MKWVKYCVTKLGTDFKFCIEYSFYLFIDFQLLKLIFDCSFYWHLRLLRDLANWCKNNIPDNYCIVNDSEKEAHIPVPVDGSEEFLLVHLWPYSNITSSLILESWISKCNSDKNIWSHINFTVRILDVWWCILYHWY